MITTEIKSYSVSIELQTIDIGTDLIAYKLRVDHPHEGSTESQGVAAKKELDSLRKGITPRQEYFRMDAETLAECQARGQLALNDEKFFKKIDRNLFDHVVSGGAIGEIYRYHSYNNSIWRLDGTLLPTGIVFDYIHANMNDVNYDLPKTVEILRGREDIHFVMPRQGKLDPRYPEIHRIPSYNCDAGSKQIAFTWLPNQEQAERLESLTSWDRFELIFSEDMLGLRSGGAALRDSFNYYPEDDDGDED